MVHLLVEIIVYRKQITNEKTNVAGSHQEDKMEDLTLAITQVIGAPSSFPILVAVAHSETVFNDTVLKAMCC